MSPPPKPPKPRPGTAVPQPCRRTTRTELTLLFTDLVASTERAERDGDESWLALMLRHNAIVRACLAKRAGHEVNHVGDGFFATFERSSQAIRCAMEIRAALTAIGLDLRIGIHAGPCDVVTTDVIGIAVHVAARVATVAEPGEILVSQSVRNSVRRSRLRFAARERRPLKGLSESWQLYSVAPTPIPCAA